MGNGDLTQRESPGIALMTRAESSRGRRKESSGGAFPARSGPSEPALSGRFLIDIRPGDTASIREMTQTQLFGLILRLVQMTFRFDSCAAFSYDPKHRTLILSQNIGLPGGALGAETISLDDDPAIEQVVAEAKAMVINTPMSESQPTLLRSFMAVPIVLDDSVVGTLNMSMVSDRPYEDDDLQRLNAIASQAAVLVRSLRTLSELEVEQREILETVPLPIARIDFTKQAYVVNAAAKVFFDLPAEKSTLEIFYRHAKEFIDRDLTVLLNDVLKSGRDIGGIEIHGRGDRDAIFNLTISAIAHEDKTLGAVLVFEDLTEILHAREIAERNERLAALGQLAAGVAHEIKNPLTSIKGFTQLLKTKKKDAGFIDKYVTLVSGEVDRLDRIVEQLLQLARPKSTKLQAADLRVTVRRVTHLIEAQIEKKQIKLSDTFPDRPVAVMMDPPQIEQVVLNILLNAVEACPTRGGTIHVSVEPTAKSVILSIQDNGRGIKAEHLEKLFHPFFTTRQGGTGLGLAVSHRIVTDHGGRIFVTTEPGKGARFAVELTKPSEERSR